MIKDHTRDYVTNMYRVWALCKNKNIDVSELDESIRLDVEAVEKTFTQLEEQEDNVIIDAVKAVYCILPRYDICHGSITLRVRRFAMEYPCSEAQVYRWLKVARRMCATNRGLSL